MSFINANFGTPLSQAFPSYYGVNGISPNTWVSANRFINRQSLKDFNPALRAALIRTREALGVVLDGSGQVMAQSMVVANGLALISGHSADSLVRLKFPGFKPLRGKVIFDGNVLGLDFKFVQTQPLGIQPVPLMVSKSVGNALQFSYKDRVLMVQLFSLDNLVVSSRSSRGGISEAGDSGGARFDLTFGAVQSILQGNGEGLEISSIISAMQANTQSGICNDILNLIKPQCRDLDMLYISSTSIPLLLGSVDEEAKGLSKKVLFESGIFTEHFVAKHTARDKATALDNATSYGNTVTVIKVTESYLKTLKDIHSKKELCLKPTTVWHFVNGIEKRAHGEVHIRYENGKIHHLDF